MHFDSKNVAFKHFYILLSVVLYRYPLSYNCGSNMANKYLFIYLFIYRATVENDCNLLVCCPLCNKIILNQDFNSYCAFHWYHFIALLSPIPSLLSTCVVNIGDARMGKLVGE